MDRTDPNYVQAIIDQKAYSLSFAQQDFVKKNFKDMSLLELTRKTYKEEGLDERTIEYDQIRRFVAKVKNNVLPVQFSVEALTFIENNSHAMKPIELAKNLFPDKKIVALSRETQTISEYLKAVGVGSEEATNDEYRPPKAASSLVRKINGAVPQANWDVNDLTAFQKKCVESLKSYLGSARVASFIKITPELEMKQLFEEEFVKAVHDKHDLNTEELNMYISLCSEYVNIQQQTRAKNILEAKITNTVEGDDDSKKLYMTWVDLLNSREGEIHRSKTRAKDLQTALSSTRSKRLESLAAVNESLSKFVEEFKSEEGRARAIIISEAKALDLAKEIDRIESSEDYIANVMGIGKDEILRF